MVPERKKEMAETIGIQMTSQGIFIPRAAYLDWGEIEIVEAIKEQERIILQPKTPTRNVSPHAGTASDLAQSSLVGIWADRDDIVDSLAYARQLRAQAERRNHVAP